MTLHLIKIITYNIISKGDIMNKFFNFDEIKDHIDFIDTEKSKSFVKWIYSLSPYEFTAVAAIIGLLIAPNLNINEQDSIGNFLIEIGQVLLTVNSHTITQNPNLVIGEDQAQKLIEDSKSEFNKKLAILQHQINNLKIPPIQKK